MNTWIALFRGINVGGNHILPMAELRALLESLGLEKVRTYIQSGNVVFESRSKSASTLSRKIESAVETGYGFRPRTLVLDRKAWVAAIAANPFPEAVQDPKTLHFLFLESCPKTIDEDGLNQLKADSERFHLAGKVFYFHAPEGIARSKLAVGAERHLGVAATGRNFRTVEKILAMTADPKPA